MIDQSFGIVLARKYNQALSQMAKLPGEILKMERCNNGFRFVVLLKAGPKVGPIDCVLDHFAGDDDLTRMSHFTQSVPRPQYDPADVAFNQTEAALDPKRVEQVARIMAPDAWRIFDDVMQPYRDGTGGTGGRSHYTESQNAGVSTAGECRMWFLDVYPNPHANTCRQSLQRAADAITYIERSAT